LFVRFKIMPDTTGQEPVDKQEHEEQPCNEESKCEGGGGDDSVNSCPDPYYPPIIFLPEVDVPTGEDDEEVMIKIRARLYRYAHECDPPEWKERGTGDIKILKHTLHNTARVVMRREKTMKLCLNHLIQPWMQLKKNIGSEKAWVWKTQADYADDECKHETLAVRFSNIDNAKKWETAFEKARVFVLEKEAEKIWKEEKGGTKDLKDGKNSTKEDLENKENKKDVENKENVDLNKEKGVTANNGVTETQDDLTKTSNDVTDQKDDVTDKMAELIVNK